MSTTAATPQPIAATNSLFEIDAELDAMFDVMQEEINTAGEISAESKAKFEIYCDALGDKVDRIGRFLRAQESIAEACKKEADRLTTRAKTAENKVAQTKNMLLYFMGARNLAKLEGKTFCLRSQKNSADSVRVLSVDEVPFPYRRLELVVNGDLWEVVVNSVPTDIRPALVQAIKGTSVNNDAVKEAAKRNEPVPGVEVIRGRHLRVA